MRRTWRVLATVRVIILAACIGMALALDHSQLAASTTLEQVEDTLPVALQIEIGAAARSISRFLKAQGTSRVSLDRFDAPPGSASNFAKLLSATLSQDLKKHGIDIQPRAEITILVQANALAGKSGQTDLLLAFRVRGQGKALFEIQRAVLGNDDLTPLLAQTASAETLTTTRLVVLLPPGAELTIDGIAADQKSSTGDRRVFDLAGRKSVTLKYRVSGKDVEFKVLPNPNQENEIDLRHGLPPPLPPAFQPPVKKAP